MGRSGAREEGLPVHRGALDVQLGECGQGGFSFGAVAAQERDAALGEGGEDAVGADLQEGRHSAFGTEVFQGVVEADGIADVAYPVLGIHLGGLAGDRASGRVVRQPSRNRAEGVQHRVHAVRVEGVADLQPLVLPGGGQLEYGFLVAGEHDRLGAVDGGDIDAVDQQRTHLVLRGLDRDHRATLGKGLHQAARGHQRAGILQGEHPGDMRCRDLAHRMPGQTVRADTPGLDEPVQRDLDREQRRLGVLRTVQQLGILTEHRLSEREFEARADRVEGFGVDREGFVQPPFPCRGAGCPAR